MHHLAAITAALADWLARQPLDQLPRLANVEASFGLIELDEYGNNTARLQLGARDPLTSMADWAEHLHTSATITRSGGNSRAEIITAASADYRVSLWTFFGVDELYALRTLGVRITTTPTQVTPEVLRQAAAYLADHPEEAA